jgi:hypothetical protein
MHFYYIDIKLNRLLIGLYCLPWLQEKVVSIALISKDKNRLLKVCYVPATSASLPRLLFYAAINSTNETNKAGSMCNSSVYITYNSMASGHCKHNGAA